MKIVTLVTAVTLGFGTASFAGGTTVPAPDPEISMTAPIAAGTDWGGFYAGATYGVGIGGNMDYETGGLITNEYDSLEPGSSYGAFAGYNVQRNNLVYGGEIAYSAVDTPGFGPIGFASETFNFFLDGKARIGYAMNNVLVYGFAGYSTSNFEFSGVTNHAVSGMNYGVGVDVMFGENLFVGAEFIARNLSGESSSGRTQTTNIQAAQLRAGWKF